MAEVADRCDGPASIGAERGPEPAVAKPDSGGEQQEAVPRPPRRASIAVMPFLDRSGAARVRGGAGDALAHDVITRLAKLRSLFVIAQGTVFALRERGIGPEEAGLLLKVDYLASGSVRRAGKRLMVEVELTETRQAGSSGRSASTAPSTMPSSFSTRSATASSPRSRGEIETLERNRAILKPPNSLDAWEAYHRGLWHMYRFDKADNEQARHFFEMALRLDPTFARAYAGLSFTHWQNAFQGWAERNPEIERAYDLAEQSLMADDRDPAAHWAMGRALWLRRRHDQSLGELERAVDLSPNFALAHYNLAFVNSTTGDPQAAVPSSDHARSLSPFDPMLFGMFGARAMALVRLGRFEEAAEWGVKAAARPNAFAHISAIAACSLALAGRLDEGRAEVAAIRKRVPNYRVDDLISAMHFPPEAERLFRKGAKRIGFD